MCGIVGYIGGNQISLEGQISSIKHRGPDASGDCYYEFENRYVGLGHARLSILDLDKHANQPFKSVGAEQVIVFNGEIYNFIELKEGLLSKGFTFRTNSDTEVLLAAYEFYGSRVVEYLDGMFAFCILDLKKNKMFCVRDHLGIKPFYFYHNKAKQEFYFCSELKGLFSFDDVPKKISKDSIAEYLFNGWLYEPETGFQDIYKLPPGGKIEINIESMELKQSIYFDVTTETGCSHVEINKIISDSILKQCRSDVPLGIFFSGGIDSSVIASKVDGAMCLSAKYRGDDLFNSGIGNDYHYSKKIAKMLDLSIKKVELAERSDNISLIKDVVINNEELNSDFTYKISEDMSFLARKSGYKVMLSGMGADELFGGYGRYKAVRYKKIYRVLAKLTKAFKRHLKKIKSIEKKVDRFYAFVNESDYCYSYSSLIGSFSRREIEGLLLNNDSIDKYHKKINKYLDNVKNETPYKKALYLDLYGFLSHNFMVADKSSMQASIELRVPLANKEILVKNFYRSDSSLFDFSSMKKDLKLILKGKIPSKILNRRKTGFNPPLDGLINRLGEGAIRRILSSQKLGHYIHVKVANDLIKEHFHEGVNNTYKLWNLIYLSIWLDLNA